MAVLTESTLRSQFFKKKLTKSILELPKGTILTPAAKSYLREKKITIAFTKNVVSTDHKKDGLSVEKKIKSHKPSIYQDIQKPIVDVPADSSHLDLFTSKEHERMALRTKIDSLTSKIVESQFALSDNEQLTSDLSELLYFIRRLLHAEMFGAPFEEDQLLGLRNKDIQSMVRNPKKHFGIDYFHADYRMGKEIVLLNSLRTYIREIELLATQVFIKEDESSCRQDLVLALNLLSHTCWLMMFRCETGYYMLKKSGDNDGK